jgi:hypothetical protein
MAPIARIPVSVQFITQISDPTACSRATGPSAAVIDDGLSSRDIERILERRPPTAEETEALARAAREFYRQAKEIERQRRRRGLGVLAALAVVGFVAWRVWRAYR